MYKLYWVLSARLSLRNLDYFTDKRATWPVLLRYLAPRVLSESYGMILLLLVVAAGHVVRSERSDAAWLPPVRAAVPHSP